MGGIVFTGSAHKATKHHDKSKHIKAAPIKSEGEKGVLGGSVGQRQRTTSEWRRSARSGMKSVLAKEKKRFFPLK